MERSKIRLVFIVGATGSGTTMLTRILSSPSQCVGLGGNHISVPPTDLAAYPLVEQFNQASARLWDRHADAATTRAAGQEMVTLVDRLRDLKPYSAISHVIYKRSFPFFPGDKFRPDLNDLFELFGDVRLVVLYRDPRASTASSLRREFLPNLRSCSIVTEEQLTYISAQLATLERATYQVVPYESLCDQPAATAHAIAQFTGVNTDEIAQAARVEQVKSDRNERWAKEMAPEDVAFLNQFFNERRRRQWPLLSQPTPATPARPTGFNILQRLLKPATRQPASTSPI